MNERVVFAKQLAEVVRRLHDSGVRADDPQLPTKFLNAFHNVLGGSVVQRAAHVDVRLPDLEDGIQADIVKENVLALSALYFAAQLEDLKFFMVADKVAEQFIQGMIPISRTLGGEAIYTYYRKAVDRFTEAERRGMFSRAFGFAQGAVEDELPNREFNDVWIRFLSAVSLFSREFEARQGIRVSLTGQTVLKAGRDLAVNLSLHGYGIAHFAAVELQDHITKTLKMLSYPDVLQAYGVLDRWQLVERVSALYLGGAVNGVRQRTLATAGSKIIQWLAAYSRVLANPHRGVFDPRTPDNRGLIENVESWLAMTGTDDQSVERYSDAVSIQQQPTIPDMSLRSIPDALGELMSGNGVMNGAFKDLGAIAKA
jgi:hypothetical protein